MILRLEKMNLNKEQNQSLDLIKLKIKNGEIEFSNIDKQKNPSKLRNVFLLVCFAFVLGLLFYLYNQEYVVNLQNFQEASSLSAFSVQERKEIDSLLKSIPTEQADSTVETYYSSGNTISIQTPIKNKLAEKIYNELEQDMTNHFMRLYDTCIPLSKDKIITFKGFCLKFFHRKQ
jgi:cytoskeletal protein RodZ